MVPAAVNSMQKTLMGKLRTNVLRGSGSSKEEKKDSKSFDPDDLETCRTDAVCT